MLHVHEDIGLDDETMRKVTATLAKLGLTTAEAVRLLFCRIAADPGFSLELKVPNRQTQQAMDEINEMVEERRARFTHADAMFTELEIDSVQ